MEHSSTCQPPAPSTGTAHCTGGTASRPPQNQSMMEDHISQSATELAEDFDKRVQGLPAELYLLIYEEVFTAKAPQQKSLIDSHYRPPALKQVDRASRDLFARSYYSGNIFRVYDLDTCQSWISSLALHYAGCISRIQYGGVWDEPSVRGLLGGRHYRLRCRGEIAANSACSGGCSGEEERKLVDAVSGALQVGVVLFGGGDEEVTWTGDVFGALRAKRGESS